MNINLAGNVGIISREIRFNRLFKRRLLSFYEVFQKLFASDLSFRYITTKNMKEQATRKVELFLDSGAYSAWSQGKEINIQEYIQFIKDHQDVIDVYANLDVIGSPQGTWDNQMTMEKAGLSPLPVYHYGEDEKWLKRILGRGYPYIGLGGMVPISTNDLTKWLDGLFRNYLTDADGMPVVKVHGFGLTSLRLMLRYPWYCMTEEDHTVLTKKGWSSLSDLTVGDEILCFNNGKSEWQSIMEIPIFDVKDEKIYHLHNRNFEAFVTGNHRWKISNQNNKDKNWKFKTTEELKIGDCINRVGKPGYNTFLQEPIFTDEQVGLLAWFWTDGTIKKRPKYKNDSVVIYQSEDANPEKCETIRNLLIKGKEKFCENKTKQGLIHFELYGNISKWLLSFAPKKEIPQNFSFMLTKKQAEMFVNYSILADGTKTNLKRITGFELVVKNKRKHDNLEVIQTICQLLGIANNSIYNEEGIYKGVRSSSVNHIYVKELKKEEILYTGKLWCVVVPSSAFFTKCRGHIYVTGNSVDSTSWVLTGRMGSIFIPRFRSGKWIYDEDSWKIIVSNRSPQSTEAGKHINTMTKLEKEILLRYIHEKGYSLGISEYKWVDQSYELAENERWVEKKPADKTAKREVEIIVEPGVSNKYQLRDEMNILYFLDLEKSMPTWPWAFKAEEMQKGLF